MVLLWLQVLNVSLFAIQDLLFLDPLLARTVKYLQPLAQVPMPTVQPSMLLKTELLAIAATLFSLDRRASLLVIPDSRFQAKLHAKMVFLKTQIAQRLLAMPLLFPSTGLPQEHAHLNF